MQFHFVKLHDVEAALRHMADAGLTTREACGNSVRNITACAYAGVSPTEAFDVTPYSEALTRYFLRHRFVVVAAAQVQDRLRGLHGRSRESDDQRHWLDSRASSTASAGSACSSAAAPPRWP
jgi:sulfite reductase beta subunit-like hemoprotein